MAKSHMCRHICDDIAEFSIACKPIGSGRNCSNNYLEGEREQFHMSRDQFINMVRMHAKAACKEQGFTLKENKEPIYLVVVIKIGFGSLNPTWSPHKEFIKRALKGNELPTRSPSARTILSYVVKALKGVAYVNENQIVATCSIKRYERTEGIEILIGSPKDIKELYHDIRNA